VSRTITNLFFRYVIFCAVFVVFCVVNAQQSSTPVQCGDIIESETTPAEPIHSFTVLVQAGTVLNGRVESVGTTFNVHIRFLDTGGNQFAWVNANEAGFAEEFTGLVISTSNPNNANRRQ
jgi:hypothetical protein